MNALDKTGCHDLVLAGGVGANRQLRAALTNMAHQKGGAVHYPPLELCTDNGVMIAFAGTLRLLQKNLTPLTYRVALISSRVGNLVRKVTKGD